MSLGVGQSAAQPSVARMRHKRRAAERERFMQDWNFSGKGDSMLGQWISNLLARSEQFSQLRLAEMCGSVSDCADAMVGAGGGS